MTDKTNNTIEIAHTGDLHLGYSASWAGQQGSVNRREADLYKLMEGLTEDIISRNPDVWVIAGDAFDATNPNPNAQAAMFRAASRARDAGIPMVVIGGNHDVANSSEISPLNHLEEFFGVHLFLDQGHVDIGDLRIHALPYYTIADYCSGRREQADFEIADDKSNVLVGHAYAYGPNLSDVPDPVIIPPELINSPDFELVMLAHIHQHVRLDDNGRAFYSGALDRLSFGEMDLNPSYWMHSIKDGELVDSESIPFSSFGIPEQPRPFFEIRIAQGDRTVDEVNRVVMTRMDDGIKPGSLAKIVISEADQIMLTSTLPELWRRRFRELGGLYVDVKVRAVQSEHELDVELTADTTLTLDESLRKFIIDAGEEDLVSMAMESLAEVQS